MSLYELERRVVDPLLRKAGDHVLQYFRNPSLVVERKYGDEPVTRADREASDILVAGLRAAFPDDIHISEEAPDDLRRLEPGRRVWFIDPIDGTNDFIHGRDGFALMIGLATQGAARFGALYQPVGNRLYWGAPGVFAELVEHDRTTPLAVSTQAALPEARLVASRSHRTGTMDQVKGALGIKDELNVGSVGLKLGLIARGVRDLYVNPSASCKAWDSCGPLAVLAAAGGRLTDVHGAELRYDIPDLGHERGLLATNGALHAETVTRLAALFPPPAA